MTPPTGSILRSLCRRADVGLGLALVISCTIAFAAPADQKDKDKKGKKASSHGQGDASPLVLARKNRCERRPDGRCRRGGGTVLPRGRMGLGRWHVLVSDAGL